MQSRPTAKSAPTSTSLRQCLHVILLPRQVARRWRFLWFNDGNDLHLSAVVSPCFVYFVLYGHPSSSVAEERGTIDVLLSKFFDLRNRLRSYRFLNCSHSLDLFRILFIGVIDQGNFLFLKRWLFRFGSLFSITECVLLGYLKKNHIKFVITKINMCTF